MKIIDTQFDTPTLGRPRLSGTTDHERLSLREIADSLIKGLLGTYTANDLIVIYGCVVNASNPALYTITQGAIYYNGEIYQVAAASIVIAGGQIGVFKIDLNPLAPDPTPFTDGVPRNVHIDRVISIHSGASGSGIADYNGATVKPLQSLGIKTSWTNFPNVYIGGYSANGSYPPQYKISNQRVYFRGLIDYSSPSSSLICNTGLPASILPTNLRYGIIAQGISTTPARMYIDNTSTINLEALPTGTGSIILDGFYYPLD
jgi:hypothetical protein